ncbi:MAG: hypothetical protein IPJ77_22495 [Planctomycetes bacterium]|nr:hypothetical protein [Planctomycetota bacterium]
MPVRLWLPVLEPISTCFALTGSDVLLLVGVVGGGLLVTWLVLQLVLRETAAFSRNFPRKDAPSSTATGTEDPEALAAQARHQQAHAHALHSRHDAHATRCDEPDPHVHQDGCEHDSGVGLDAPGPARDDGAR